MEKKGGVIKWGKLDVTHGISSKRSIDRVPFSYVATHPNDPNLILLSGGPFVTLNKISETTQSTLNAYHVLDNYESYDNNKDSISRWLHAEPCGPDITCNLICTYKYHAPSVINRACFSPDGSLALVQDNFLASIWDLAHDDPAATYRCGSEIFDAIWLNRSHIAVGTVGQILLIKFPEMDVLATIQLKDSWLVRGMTATAVTTTAPDRFELVRLAVTTNGSFACVYEVQISAASIDYRIVVQAPSKFFDPILANSPILKLPTFSPCTRYCTFPYADRRGQSFALMLDTESQVDPYRLRGHMSRVNCVASGHTLRELGMQVSDFIRGEKEDTMWDILKEHATLSFSHPLAPLYSVLAISSVDGCLSVWAVFQSFNNSEVSAMCIAATPNSIVDQTGIVTSLAWSCDDRRLYISSDDGKITTLSFDWGSLAGKELLTRAPSPDCVPIHISKEI